WGSADLQIDARQRPFAADNSRFSEETRVLPREIVRGVRRPRKSGSEERLLPSLISNRGLPLAVSDPKDRRDGRASRLTGLLRNDLEGLHLEATTLVVRVLRRGDAQMW